MRTAHLAILAFVGFALPQGPTTQKTEELYLCNALEQVRPGDQLPVLLTGVVVVGPEHQFFFDPRHPACAMDVQPSTWLEFATGMSKPARLERILKNDRRALVTLRGELYGPPSLGPDDAALSPGLAYANRIAGRRYGHLGRFRTKLVAHELLDIQRVPPELDTEPIIDRRSSDDDIALDSGDLPLYPEPARRAGIEGDVAVRVIVKSGEVMSAEPLSGDRMLAGHTATYVKSWRFASGVDAEFTSLFVYRLESRPRGVAAVLRHELQLPHFARITAARYEW